jgi:hypothetical protein
MVRRCPTPTSSRTQTCPTLPRRSPSHSATRVVSAFATPTELMAAELAKAERPVSTRELVQIICQTEGKNGQDRRVFADVTKRASKALREMRRLGIVASEQDRRGTFVWAPSRKGEYHNVTTFGQSGEESVVRAIPHPSCLGGRPDRNCCHLVRISKGRLC